MTPLETIAASVGTSTIAVAALQWVLRTWISERLHQAIAHEYAEKLERYKIELTSASAVELERLRSQLTQQRALMALGEDQLREALRVAHTKRVEAVDRLWATILQINARIPPALALTDYMTDCENQGFLALDGPRSSLEGLSIATINAQILSSTADAALERIKVGELLYALFDAYRTIIARASITLVRGRDEGQITPWYTDSIVCSVLNSIFSQDELSDFKSASLGKLTWVRTRLERKFIESARDVLSGHASANQAVQQAQAIEEAVARATRGQTTNA